AYESQKKYQLAVEVYQRMAKVDGPPNKGRAHLARTFARLGRTAEARAVARELETLWPTGQVAPTEIASIYAGLAENDRAFFWLEKALQTLDVSLRDSIRMVPFSNVHDDPRYDEFLRRMLAAG
ncbi:MAG: hypothetical protein ABIP63_01065, partial [Thermoanaerobaculia bacterium]